MEYAQKTQDSCIQVQSSFFYLFFFKPNSYRVTDLE